MPWPGLASWIPSFETEQRTIDLHSNRKDFVPWQYHRFIQAFSVFKPVQHSEQRTQRTSSIGYCILWYPSTGSSNNTRPVEYKLKVITCPTLYEFYAGALRSFLLFCMILWFVADYEESGRAAIVLSLLYKALHCLRSGEDLSKDFTRFSSATWSQYWQDQFLRAIE